MKKLQAKKCIGCGAILQTEYKDKAGYVPSLNIDSLKNIYCKRCFRLNHYNEMPKILADPKDYLNVLNGCLKKNGLIVLIVDLFDFTGTFIPDIINHLRDKEVILVANKLDLLPKSTNVAKIVDWLSYMVNRIFFRVDAIHVVSSKKGYYLDELMNTIDFLRKGRDVYFVGCANVGKSSLINGLLKRFTTRCDDLISTSEIPGTTLDTINIPFFEDNKAFIDTPGLINVNNIFSKILPVSYKKILPKNEIKPITYQLKFGNCIYVSGLAVFDLLSGDNVSFTCYFSNELLLHRSKSEKIDEFLNTHLGKMLNPPSLEEVNLEYEDIEFEIGNKKKDIVISGLGFICINKPCRIRVKVIKDTDVFLRNAIIGE
ncbi:MAG: ribosome biogenesis GTPase YqeH [Anaeroplasmataceae bacterium]